MKKLISLILWVAIIVVALLLTKNLIAKAAVEVGVKAVTGLELKTRALDVNLSKTYLNVDGLRIQNPAGFPDPVMLDMPVIYVDYDLSELIGGKIHLWDVKLELTEFVVVRDKNGKLNLDALKSVQAQKGKPAEPAKKPEPGKAPPLQIDTLSLKIGKVVYKDYSVGAKPMVQEFKINIDETYKNITDPNTLVNLLIVRALMNTPIAMLTSFDLGSLNQNVMGAMALSGEAAAKLGAKAQESAQAAAAQAQAKLAESQKKLGEQAGQLTESAKTTVGETTQQVEEKAKELVGSLKDKIKLPLGGEKPAETQPAAE